MPVRTRLSYKSERIANVLEVSFIVYTVVIPVVSDRSLLSLELGEALFPLQTICYKNRPTEKRTFHHLIKHGALKTLDARLDTGVGVWHSDIMEELEYCCALGRLDEIRWLHNTFKLTRKDANDFALAVCCDHGHIDVAKWLHATFHFTAADARSDNNCALMWSCANGHVDVAAWLSDTFHLTADDVRVYDNYALRECCDRGNLDMVRWICTTFGLTGIDVRALFNYALRYSCIHGHLHVAKWLHATFRLTADDTRSFGIEELHWCRPEVVQWLRDTFGYVP
jgi:hypothetical protein